jgi:acyl-CoA thioester hydrolase
MYEHDMERDIVMDRESNQGDSSTGKFKFFHPIEIRYGDIDAQRHVNNARYFSFMEQARARYLQHLGLWQGHDFDTIGIILAEQRCKYFEPIMYDQEIHVGVRVARLGQKSMGTEYLIQVPDGQSVLAFGEAILVAYSYEEGRSISVPDTWRRTIVEFEGH